MKTLLKTLVVIVLGFVLIDCSSTQVEEKEFEELPSGLKIKDLVVGEGEMPTKGKTISLHYVGSLTDSTIFDSSRDRNAAFTFRYKIDGMIKGFDEGIETMRVGGKRIIVIPPELGYGNRSTGKIPPNSTLIFEIELLEVK